MKCDKIVYRSRVEAKKRLKELNKTGGLKKKLTNVYFCDICQNWHTTSMNTKQSRNITHKNKNK